MDLTMTINNADISIVEPMRAFLHQISPKSSLSVEQLYPSKDVALEERRKKGGGGFRMPFAICKSKAAKKREGCLGNGGNGKIRCTLTQIFCPAFIKRTDA